MEQQLYAVTGNGVLYAVLERRYAESFVEAQLAKRCGSEPAAAAKMTWAIRLARPGERPA